MKTAMTSVLLLAAAGASNAQPKNPAELRDQVVAAFRSAPAGMAIPLPNGLPQVRQIVATQSSDPLIAPGAWEKLAAPDDATLRFLAERVPGLDTAKVRDLPQSQVLALIEVAVARRLSALDVFSDEALLTDKIYYISSGTLAAIEQRYELNSLFQIQGQTIDGNPFFMQAIAMGGGKVEMLYNLDGFSFKHPIFTSRGGKYKFPSRITQDIQGPGIVSFSQSKIRGPLNVRIKKFVKISPTRVKVVTSLISAEEDLNPIRRRSGYK